MRSPYTEIPKIYYSAKEATVRNHQNQALACFNIEEIGELFMGFNETLFPK